MPNPTPLSLKPHAFACMVDDEMIFLDVKNDQYFQLDPKQAPIAAAMLGMSLSNSNKEHHSDAQLSISDAEREAIINKLVDIGVAMRSDGRETTRNTFNDTRSLREAPSLIPVSEPRINVTDILKLARAYIATTIRLRFFGLESSIAHLRKSKRGIPDTLNADDKMNTLFALVERYKTLKPVFVKTQDNCLFNALFLIEFLAMHGEPAELWIGVRVHDFGAHAWVRQGDILIDDFLHTVAQYKPILVV
ncbi:MAG: lasso peptide biosynthesis B2 protein [Pseudomonadota bacterium]